jgi:glycosyltransferase involved in cell wall biosynthesis
MATIALCIPAYNAACHLPRLLESAHQQSIPFDEIWVYDDASLDNTSDVAHRYGARVVQGITNVGCSAGKNELLRNSRAEWIHFHDADDLLLPQFTHLAHKWIRGDSCPDVVLFDYEYRDNDSFDLISKSDFNPLELELDPLRYAILHQINPFCGLYRRDKLLSVGGYDIDSKILYNEDVAFHCKLARHGFTFSAEKKVSIINFRMSSSMSSSNRARCLQAQVEVMLRLAAAVGSLYPNEIKYKLWHAAQGLAALDAWRDVDVALSTANSLTHVIPPRQSLVFKVLVFLFGSKTSFRLREYGIRLFKPWVPRP